MQSLTHFLRSSNLNSNSFFSDRELFAFLSEANEEKLKKKTLLRCARLQSLLVASRNTNTPKERKTKETCHQIDDKARLFWESILKTKHLASLFKRLIPGADGVVRNICIRPMKCETLQTSGLVMQNVRLPIVSVIIRLNCGKILELRFSTVDLLGETVKTS